MQILSARSSSTGTHLVLIFGLGMLGSAIRSRLHDCNYRVEAEVDFPWNEAAGWGSAFAAIGHYCQVESQQPGRLSFVWSAGRGGFGCTADEAQAENAAFQVVLRFLAELQTALGLAELDLHFISSAGGLFEGQRVVGPDSTPAPMRPYGHLKLAQEKALLDRFAKQEISIYRPSSVYGPMVQKARQGLINNLINDALRGSETVLDAQVMSLRDYVYSGDIGHFVAQRIQARPDDSWLHFLVSSRASSIFEVVRAVERVLHLKLRFRYDQKFGNHSNITFSDSVLPPGWRPSALDVGIRQFMVGKNAPSSVPARQ